MDPPLQVLLWWCRRPEFAFAQAALASTTEPTTKNTARHLHQTITPFQAMLEAPRSIIEVYQTHSRALRDLVVVRDKVLTAVLDDLAARVMDHLQGVSWRDLETLGAVHQQPPRPAGYDDLEF